MLAVLTAGVVPRADGAPAAVARVQATHAALESTTAELALTRTRARALAGSALAANVRRQRALEGRKARLLAGLRDQVPEATRAVARARRSAAARRRAAAAAPSPAVATAPTGSDAALVSAIDGYLASKASPLTGEGATFVARSRAVGLDPRLLVAIAGAETAFGTYGPSQTIHNPFGMGPGIVYGSWAEAIDAAARNLGGDLYLGSGLTTISAIHGRWAPVGAQNDPGGLNGGWAANVGHYFSELGGDPAAPVFGARTAAPEPAAPAAPATPARDRSPRQQATAHEHPGDRPARGTGRRLESRMFPDPGDAAPMLDAATG